MRRLGRREDGAAAVEFAIVSTVLFLIVFGIIEFGRTYSQYEVLQGAAREGARRAAVGATVTQVRDAVTQAADPYTLTTTPAVDRTCTFNTVGQPVTVSWNQTFQISIPFMPVANVTRKIKGVFRCE
jgi:Flp pilus assembly protein TadG